MADNKQVVTASEDEPLAQKTNQQVGPGGFSMPKVFDLTLLTQNKDGAEKTKGILYNYFWKKFDFRGGKTFSEVQELHPYCKDPVKSLSK